MATAVMLTYTHLFAAVLLLFAPHSFARELKQASCPAQIVQAISAKAQSPAFTTELAAKCPTGPAAAGEMCTLRLHTVQTAAELAGPSRGCEVHKFVHAEKHNLHSHHAHSLL